MTAWKTIALGFGLVLASAPFVSSARADEWNKETKVTFANPVEIPGRVLLPGTYVFKLAEGNTDRQLVEIYNDNDRLVTTVTGVSDHRVKAPNETVMTFSEGRKSAPESLHEWFYPGNNDGLEFLYPAK